MRKSRYKIIEVSVSTKEQLRTPGELLKYSSNRFKIKVVIICALNGVEEIRTFFDGLSICILELSGKFYPCIY